MNTSIQNIDMTQQFNDLKQAALSASKGDWETDEKDHDEPYQNIKIKAGAHHTICTIWIDDAPVRDFNAIQAANARYIVAARPDRILALLAELERLDGIASELQALCDKQAFALVKARAKLYELEGQKPIGHARANLGTGGRPYIEWWVQPRIGDKFYAAAGAQHSTDEELLAKMSPKDTLPADVPAPKGFVGTVSIDSGVATLPSGIQVNLLQVLTTINLAASSTGLNLYCEAADMLSQLIGIEQGPQEELVECKFDQAGTLIR